MREIRENAARPQKREKRNGAPSWHGKGENKYWARANKKRREGEKDGKWWWVAEKGKRLAFLTFAILEHDFPAIMTLKENNTFHFQWHQYKNCELSCVGQCEFCYYLQNINFYRIFRKTKKISHIPRKHKLPSNVSYMLHFLLLPKAVSPISPFFFEQHFCGLRRRRRRKRLHNCPYKKGFPFLSEEEEEGNEPHILQQPKKGFAGKSFAASNALANPEIRGFAP